MPFLEWCGCPSVAWVGRALPLPPVCAGPFLLFAFLAFSASSSILGFLAMCFPPSPLSFVPITVRRQQDRLHQQVGQSSQFVKGSLGSGHPSQLLVMRFHLGKATQTALLDLAGQFMGLFTLADVDLADAVTGPDGAVVVAAVPSPVPAHGASCSTRNTFPQWRTSGPVVGTARSLILPACRRLKRDQRGRLASGVGLLAADEIPMSV